MDRLLLLIPAGLTAVLAGLDPVVVREVDGVAVGVEGEGDQAARIAGGQRAEVVVLGQDVVAVGRDDRARRDLVLRQIGTAVADEPVADVDRLGSRVVELDHVAGGAGGVRHHLVDDDRTGQRGASRGRRCRACRRACRWAPSRSWNPRAKALGWRWDHQRETAAGGLRIPGAL